MAYQGEHTIQLPLLKSIQKFPGGLMTVFFLLGSMVTTWAPGFLHIGGFTTGLFKEGALPMIGLVLLCCGAQISLRRSGAALYKGAFLTAVKVLLGLGTGYIYALLLAGRESVFSIHPVTLIIALSCGNGGLYLALSERYGNSEDTAAGAVVMLTASPFFIFIGMGSGGMADIGALDIAASIAPVLIGMVIGNLDRDFREFLAPGIKLSIPFFAFALGANIPLGDILIAGPQGALLALLTLLITGLLPVGLYRAGIPKRWRSSSSIAAGIGNTAGSAAVIPALIAQIDPSYAPFAVLATAQVGSSAVITAVLSPLLFRWLYGKETAGVSFGEESV